MTKKTATLKGWNKVPFDGIATHYDNPEFPGIILIGTGGSTTTFKTGSSGSYRTPKRWTVVDTYRGADRRDVKTWNPSNTRSGLPLADALLAARSLIRGRETTTVIRVVLINYDGCTTAHQFTDFPTAYEWALSEVANNTRVGKIILSDGRSLQEYTHEDLVDIVDKNHERARVAEALNDHTTLVCYECGSEDDNEDGTCYDCGCEDRETKADYTRRTMKR